MRGVATGANEFFFLTTSQADGLQIPGEFLIPAIGRTRDVPGNTIDDDLLRALERKGRPTLLFSPDDRLMARFPPAVRDYLRQGEESGVSGRTLIRTRHPWYKMERRRVPPVLFAYLGRRNARFMWNAAGVVPLTGFLCVYPRCADPSFARKLWMALKSPEIPENLSRVGKSYGAGAIKVEPRGLERMPLSTSLIARVGLRTPPRQRQLEVLSAV